MREFKCSPYGDVVDLDDPKTYDHLPKTSKELDDLMFCEIGKALVYMDYFHSDWFHKKKKTGLMSACSKQRQRINKLIKNFADNRKDHYNDILWYQEQIFLFQDETENMC